MSRNFLVCLAFLFPTSLSFSQYQTQEPPLADPDEPAKPVNPNSILRIQPQYLAPSIQSSQPTISVSSAPEEPSPEFIPAQHIQPAGASNLPPKTPWEAKPAYPEPPVPTVKISVKGMDIAPINQELSYRLIATNTSLGKAHHVTVRCPLPKGATFVRSVPDAKLSESRALEWHLDTLEGGASRQMDVVFKPAAETEDLTVIGIVQFDHGRYVKTKISQPTLSVKKSGPAQAFIGEPATYRIEITNNGKVPAKEIEVVDTLPDGLEYLQETAKGAAPAARDGLAAHQRAWSVGTLLPTQQKVIEFRATPRKVGKWDTVCHVTATDVKQIEAKFSTNIVDAKLALQVDGPSQSDSKVGVSVPYRITVHNMGTAPLNNVRVECNFPEDLRLGKASKGGHFFKDAIQWLIPTLAPKDTKELTVSLVAPSSGERQILVAAKADRGLEQRQTIKTKFEGIEALNWKVDGTAISAVGKEVTYTIVVNNPGSGAARNVKVTADLPSSIELSKAEPSFQRDAKSNSLYFNAVEIPPKQNITIKITGIARKSGEARFHFELRADGVGNGPLQKTPITQIAPTTAPQPKSAENVGAIAPQKEALPVSAPPKKADRELPAEAPKKKDNTPLLFDPPSTPPAPLPTKEEPIKPVSNSAPKEPMKLEILPTPKLEQPKAKEGPKPPMPAPEPEIMLPPLP
jgi:uncharacterized repeat protein (TIGR01451 family)